MGFLSKEKSILQRDEQGNLIPQTVILELLDDKPEIKAIPMTRSDFQKVAERIQKGETVDSEIVLKNCIEPKYTEEEVKWIKPNVLNAIVTSIISLSSGRTQQDIAKAATEEVSKSFRN